MSSDANAVQTLTQLGLTTLEARIYIAICQYESLSTKELSKLTKTSQPDTYRVLAKLQKKGLIEKIIEKPVRFKALPFETGVSFLLQRKKVEHDDLKARTKLLLRTFKEKPRGMPPENSQFVMIPQRETVVTRIREAIDKAEKSIDLYLSWKRFVAGTTTAFTETLKRTMERGVKFRFVVESPEEGTTAEQTISLCRKNTICDIRFLPGCPKTVVGIYDRKEVFVIVNPKEGLAESPALWSNNQSLISVVQDYFDILWITAMEENKPS